MSNKRRYLNLLLAYGDHKWRCHTAKDLWAGVKNIRECNCGWAEIRAALQKTERVTEPAPSPSPEEEFPVKTEDPNTLELKCDCCDDVAIFRKGAVYDFGYKNADEPVHFEQGHLNIISVMSSGQAEVMFTPDDMKKLRDWLLVMYPIDT